MKLNRKIWSVISWNCRNCNEINQKKTFKKSFILFYFSSCLQIRLTWLEAGLKMQMVVFTLMFLKIEIYFNLMKRRIEIQPQKHKRKLNWSGIKTFLAPNRKSCRNQLISDFLDNFYSIFVQKPALTKMKSINSIHPAASFLIFKQSRIYLMPALSLNAGWIVWISFSSSFKAGVVLIRRFH